MSNCIGQDNWVAYLQECARNARTLDLCTATIENFSRGMEAEPGSLDLWSLYCEFFHELYENACTPNTSGSRMAWWSQEDVELARSIFTLDSTLSLWQRGYEAVQWRVNDSHLLWNRWVELEMQQLLRTRTTEGVRRITHLYRDRLRVPHLTWDQTSSTFASFLSQFSPEVWEVTMQQVTEDAQPGKLIMGERRAEFEYKIIKAQRDKRQDIERTILLEYIDWEISNMGYHYRKRSPHMDLVYKVGIGLFMRVLTGIFYRDAGVWEDYVAHLGVYEGDKPNHLRDVAYVLQRATEHCPWSGELWSRRLLACENLGSPYSGVESIKIAATSTPQLLEGGLESLLAIYIAWCGYLKRHVALIGGESFILADREFHAALKDIQIRGQQLYQKEYTGDPQFRVERIYIQYLTEVRRDLESARAFWESMLKPSLPYHNSFAFWQQFYQWEMMVHGFAPNSPPPTMSNGPIQPLGLRLPIRATDVLKRAVNQPNLDYHAEMMQLYVQHCHQYQDVLLIRHCQDLARRIGKAVAKKAEKQAQVAAEQQAAYVAQQVQAQIRAHTDNQLSTRAAEPEEVSPSIKRKRDTGDAVQTSELPKRARHEGDASAMSEPSPVASSAPTTDDKPKRDREHTTALVSGLPKDVSAGLLRRTFQEFGQIVDVHIAKEVSGDTKVAMVEFENADDAATFIQLRNNKYFGEYQMTVTSGFHLTVFMTNFPPTADNAFIHNLFKNCGEIIDIRWPSLKFNVTRRFCYVTFRDLESSTKAVALDKSKSGTYRIDIAFSDPANKRRRQGATAEGREVFINNVDSSATEEEIRKVFEKYGAIDTVRLLKGLSGRPFGTSFVVFEVKEDAEKAVAELNNIKFKSRIMHVEISQPRNFKTSAKSNGENGTDASGDAIMGDSEKPVSGEAEARSMALMNLPDTVNDARVKALVSPFGTVTRLVLLPAQGSAKVEFSEASASGRAQMALNGQEFEGRKLRTGTLRDLRGNGYSNGSSGPKSQLAVTSASTNIPATKLFAPVRRLPIKSGKTKPTAKKAAVQEPPAGDARMENAGSGSSTGKSNADFKAMFLAGTK